MSLENLTIVIITHNRYEYLERLLDYYGSFDLNCPIVILDSSSDTVTSPHLKQMLAKAKVTHQKFDTATFFNLKVGQGVQKVNTPFFVICADDDFIIPDALSQCVDFLMGHPDYVCAHGQYTNHLLAPKDKKFIWSSLYKNAFSIEFDQPLERFEKFFPNGGEGLPFYAVLRTKDIQGVLRLTPDYVDDIMLGELFSVCCTLLAGKMKILPVFYSSREANIFEWYNEGHRKLMYPADKVQRVIDGLAEFVYHRYGVDRAQARSLFKNRFDLYIARFMEPARKKSHLSILWSKVQRRIDDVIWVLKMGGNIPLFFKNLNILKKTVQKAGLDPELLKRTRLEYLSQFKEA